MVDLTGRTTISKLTESTMMTIPCKSDPDLCMQLDAWDADTSVPALLNGEHSVLFREHYDRKSDAWIMRLA